MRRITILAALWLALGGALARLEAEFQLSVYPPVERPYLGALCVDPLTDAHLTTCYGLDPFSGMEYMP